MAMVLDTFISRLSYMLIQLVEEKVGMLLGVDNEIQNLGSMLDMICSILEDAERRRISEKSVDRWLKKLRDIMYDADDIFDLCRIEAEKYSSKSRPLKSLRLSCLPLPTCFCNPVFANDIGKRIKNLNRSLEDLSKDKYGFLTLRHGLHDDYRVSEISEKTSSIVERDLVGTKIRGDTRKLINLITREDPRENVLVFAIVGMGGIGKTTLAQLVFNDDIIKGHFPMKFWVSVSKSFNENDVLRAVIYSADGGVLSESVSRNQVENKLVDIVKGNKFLLVLDDVWDESVWDKLLRNPLSTAAAGSSVLVTSRTEWVAKQMKAVYCHHVDVLPREDGWSLLCKKLVLSGREGEIHHLKDIGMKIVEKCGGLPLAIKAMGAILCTKSRIDWESVLRSTTWSVSGLPEHVNKALYLSYFHLPSHLKQCFMFFSLFPKDYEIFKEEVTQLWIAEGFIKDQGELSISVEETGESFFRELVWRNLLQYNRGHFPVYSYKMHDLLRSLAGFVAQEESLHIEVYKGLSDKKNISMKLRRLSIVGEMQPDVLRNKESLRTLVLFRNQSKHLNGILDHLPFLRVLKLDGSNIEELPKSLTCLMHLRYLGLKQTRIRSLPENIGNLKYLQFLNLFECKKLECLPNSIVDLKNLRGLNIVLTGVKGMPAGIQNLHHLSNLYGYILNSSEEGEQSTRKWSTLKELGPLSRLRQLAIMNLEKASHCSEGRIAALAKKPYLNSLILSCTPGWVDEATEVDIKRTEDVFEVLQPPSSMECLRIIGFPGRNFPSWMMTTVYSNLGSLIIFACKYCENLPPLGQLPKLFSLRIYDLPSIHRIGPEFMGESGGGAGIKGEHSSTFIAFPELQELIFDFMPRWEKWQWERELKAMPSLQKLTLLNCSKLISLPAGLSHHATALTELLIQNAYSLESVGKFDSLQILEIACCFRLESIFDLPALKKLSLVECPSLNKVQNLCFIQFIRLSDYKMDSLPEWLQEQSVKPEKLMIFCNPQLFEKICQRGEEEWPKIRHVSYVEIICNGGEAHAVYSKDPFSFTATSLASTSGPLINPVSAISADVENMHRSCSNRDARVLVEVQEARHPSKAVQNEIITMAVSFTPICGRNIDSI